MGHRTAGLDRRVTNGHAAAFRDRIDLVSERQILCRDDRLTIIYIGDADLCLAEKRGHCQLDHAVRTLGHRHVVVRQFEKFFLRYVELHVGVVNMDTEMYLMIITIIGVEGVTLLVIRERRQEIMFLHRHFLSELVPCPTPNSRRCTANAVIDRHGGLDHHFR